MRLTREQAVEFARAKGIPLSALGLAPDGDTPPPAPPKEDKKPKQPTKAGSKRNPQAELTALAHQRWPDQLAADYVGAVPGRKFEIDIALPAWRIAIEVDGWAYHGKHKADFHRDREKRNQLVMHGWLVLAFSARDVFADPINLLDMVDELIGRRWRAWPKHESP